MDILPPPSCADDISPPPICAINKKYLKKQRYLQNKREKTKNVIAPTVDELKKKLHDRLALNKKGEKLFTDAVAGNQFVDVNSLLARMGVHDTSTKDLVRQLLTRL
jgi:hypothetical protein